MKAFERIKALAVAMMQDNIDTDIIIPSREMKQVSKKGLSDGLFAGRRYIDSNSRELNPDFILNKRQYGDAKILIAGENFGCGSSREHAVWALKEYGIDAIIAASFSPIFYKNCINNGLLPIIVAGEIASYFACLTEDSEGSAFEINLLDQLIVDPKGEHYRFEIDEHDKKALLLGLDPIDQTLQMQKDIISFEDQRKSKHPWAFI